MKATVDDLKNALAEAASIIEGLVPGFGEYDTIAKSAMQDVARYRVLSTDNEETMEPKEFLLQFFKFEYSGDNSFDELKEKFSILANDIVRIFPRNPERTVALRKLLECIDCVNRAANTEPTE